MDTLLMAAIGLLLILLIAWPRLVSRVKERETQEPLVPDEVSLRAQPLLTKSEASFYNVLRLAVQDRYLVFAQVPVWCLVEVKSDDRKARAAFLNTIALKRVDFVLVHPGTLAAAKVVELLDPSQASGPREARDQLIDAVCKAAGIKIVRPKARMAYTVTALATLVGVEPPPE